MTEQHPIPTTPPLDVLIVGAGPAGLTAALVLGRQQRQVLVVDSGEPRNATVTDMHMYLGRDGTDPAVLRADGLDELRAHPNVRVLRGRVDSVEAADRGFTATVGAERFTARHLLLAGGVRDQADLAPGCAERWGRQLFHCPFCHGFESKGRSIAVIGSGPRDALKARYIADRFSDDVTLIAGGIEDGAEMIDLAAGAGVTIVDARLVSLSGGSDLTVLELSDGRELTAEVVYTVPPHALSDPLPVRLGCELSELDLIAVDPFMETSVAGVFAAGDAAHIRGTAEPLHFVAQAVADGQRAAVAIEQRLYLASIPAGA